MKCIHLWSTQTSLQKLVADELFIGLENNLFDIPVGDSKIYANAIGEAMSKLTQA